MAIVLVYLLGLVVIGFFGLLFYFLAVQSRKRYTCPHCGERVQTEYLDASHCNMCGTPLNRSHSD